MTGSDQQQPAAATPGPEQRVSSGLRLGMLQEQRLRQWPKDRIRPKSVALGVTSLLAECDALRDELAATKGREVVWMLQAWHLTASMDTIVRDLNEAVDEGEVTEDGLGDVLPIAKTTLMQYAATADHAFVPCPHGWGCSDMWCHYEGCPLRPERHPISAARTTGPEQGQGKEGQG